MIEYPKIPGPFKREVTGPNKNKVIPWAWTSPELEVLADIPWVFTEKVDGTNIRIIWDGYRPEFRGRTDKAQLPPKLLTALNELFPEELFEQKFGSESVTLYGEGYGAGIQRGGGNYRKDNSFILFDVKIGDWWLLREDVQDIANSLGIDIVPLRYEGSLRSAIISMSSIRLPSYVAEREAKFLTKSEPSEFEFEAEGLVGTPKIPLFTRKGDRIIVKLKGCDLYGLELD